MNHPKLDGMSIDNIADYVDGMDGHHSAGVFNKVFLALLLVLILALIV